ncbi:MAG: hypothetical protein KDA84_15155 [Planctomycetaceae bacterium]|nr:hypothetical protein [Planctomycetaceae bacterium]
MNWKHSLALLLAVVSISPVDSKAAEKDRGLRTGVATIGSQKIVSAPGFGAIRGRIVIPESEKNSIPKPKVLFDVGKAPVASKCCAAEDPIMEESLLINSKNRGLKNVFVYLKENPKGGRPKAASQSLWPTADPSGKKPVFDYDNCTFIPHAMILTVADTLTFRNQDPVIHNYRTFPFKGLTLNIVILHMQNGNPGLIDRKPFSRPEKYPVKVTDTTHPWMSAYQLPLDHPYAAVTDADGRFIISDLPPGTHEFIIWHEKGRILHRAYVAEVSADKTTDLEEILVPLKQLTK